MVRWVVSQKIVGVGAGDLVSFPRSATPFAGLHTAGSLFLTCLKIIENELKRFWPS